MSVAKINLRCMARELRITQRPGGGGTGYSLWDAGVAIAHLVDDGFRLLDKALKGSTVVELGSGCGIAGMAFALKGAHVTFTDLPALMPHLRSNLEANLDRSEHSFSATAYEWGTEPSASGLASYYDIILATDTVFNSEFVTPFVSSLTALSDSKTRVLVAVEIRDEGVWETFLDLVQEDFKVRSVAPKKLKLALKGRGGAGFEDPLDHGSWLRVLQCRKKRKPKETVELSKDSKKESESEAVDELARQLARQKLMNETLQATLEKDAQAEEEQKGARWGNTT